MTDTTNTPKPILFSGPMVRAILEGRKTQTRRVMKFQIPEDSAPFRVGLFNPIVVDRHGNEEPGPEVFGAYDDEGATYYGPFGSGDANPIRCYRELWESINGPGSWDANPFVWVVEFKRIEQEESR